MRTIVIGAGLAGLAASLELADRGIEVTLVEAQQRTGGKVLTEHTDGFLIEHGPDSFITYRTGLVDLAARLGLGDQAITANDPREVFIRVGDSLIEMPKGMGMVLPTRLGPFVTTRLLTWSQKLRAAGDLFIPRVLTDADEAIGPLVRRRLGQAVVERLADPMVGGIYGTSIEQLSVDSVLPMLRAYEHDHRSLIWASLKSGRTPRGAGSPFRTMRAGLGELADAALRELRTTPGFDERFGVAATRLATSDAGSRLTLADGDTLTADAVIMAIPAPRAAALIGHELADAAAALTDIPHSSTAVVTLAYPRDAFDGEPPTGHGFLGSGNDSPSSGITLSSNKWAGRAPDGSVLVRSFLPERSHAVFAQPDEAIFEAIERDLARVYRVHGSPTLRRVTRWLGMMPKYTVGHADRLARIDAAMAARPTWRLAGASYRGVGMPDVAASGKRAADEVVALLGGGPVPQG